MICPAFSASVWAFVLSSGPPGGAAALPTGPSKPPRLGQSPAFCQENYCLISYRQEKILPMDRTFPTGRKPGVAGRRSLTPWASSHPGPRRGKGVETPEAKRRSALQTGRYTSRGTAILAVSAHGQDAPVPQPAKRPRYTGSGTLLPVASH